jgi:hypothetical protein
MKRKPLPTLEFCKKHNVDHTGTYCGHCVELWKKHSKELKTLKKRLKSPSSKYVVIAKPSKPSFSKKAIERYMKAAGIRKGIKL